MFECIIMLFVNSHRTAKQAVIGVSTSHPNEYTLSIITSQLHCFQLKTTLNGMLFQVCFSWLWEEKQSILLQHNRKKEFWILTNKCGNKL
jgi:hypothetical protein